MRQPIYYISIVLLSLFSGCKKYHQETLSKQQLLKANTEKILHEKMVDFAEEYFKSLEIASLVFAECHNEYRCAFNFKGKVTELRNKHSAADLLRKMGYPDNTKIMPMVIVAFDAEYSKQISMSEFFLGDFHDALKPSKEQFISSKNSKNRDNEIE